MLLLIDVVSPLPEFSVIEDNNLILTKKITENIDQKLSDKIIHVYQFIEKHLNLSKKLDKIGITIGPGSYTSLRVGSAFASGLCISKNIPCCSFSVADIINFNSKNYKNKNLVVFIYSANNQKFICKYNNKNIQYTKIEDNKNLILKDSEIIFYNYKKLVSEFNSNKQIKFSFKTEFLNNLNNLNFEKNLIINPIYISNNKILN